jgi:hypothetical protein
MREAVGGMICTVLEAAKKRDIPPGLAGVILLTHLNSFMRVSHI